ncbi:MAG: hypothetical protein H0T79_16000 [Deltaproteobacteria bacterium]|nr:hypothetical protein [Deltaproteobacteria bacterium]
MTEPRPLSDAAPEPASTPEDEVFVVVDRAIDASHRLPQGAADRVTAQVKQLAARSGVATEWPDGLPTSSALAASGCRGFIISASVRRLAITTVSRQARITCDVQLHVAPWYGVDGGEKWEANATATASGSALTTTSNAPAQVARGVRECVESAVESVATREVMPFLQRAAVRPPIAMLTRRR